MTVKTARIAKNYKAKAAANAIAPSAADSEGESRGPAQTNAQALAQAIHETIRHTLPEAPPKESYNARDVKLLLALLTKGVPTFKNIDAPTTDATNLPCESVSMTPLWRDRTWLDDARWVYDAAMKRPLGYKTRSIQVKYEAHHVDAVAAALGQDDPKDPQHLPNMLHAVLNDKQQNHVPVSAWLNHPETAFTRTPTKQLLSQEHILHAIYQNGLEISDGPNKIDVTANKESDLLAFFKSYADQVKEQQDMIQRQARLEQRAEEMAAKKAERQRQAAQHARQPRLALA